jgi:hypothetical protein
MKTTKEKNKKKKGKENKEPEGRACLAWIMVNSQTHS